MLNFISPQTFPEHRVLTPFKSLLVSGLMICVFLASFLPSYINMRIGIIASASILALLALTDAFVGWLLMLVSVNFLYLFGLGSRSFPLVVGIASIAFIARSARLLRKETLRCSALWLILISFILLVLFHLNSEVSNYEILGAFGFAATVVAVFLFARNLETNDLLLAAAVICFSGLVACSLSFIYLYGPVPALFISHSPVYDLRLNDMRLSGALDNPNAIAKLLIPTTIGLFVLAAANLAPFVVWLIAIAVAGAMLAAAASKSVIIGIVAAVGLLCLGSIRRRIFFRVAAATTCLIVAMIGFSAAFLPVLKANAAEFWHKFSEPRLNYHYYQKLANDSFSDILKAEFRISVSTRTQLGKRPQKSTAGQIRKANNPFISSAEVRKLEQNGTIRAPDRRIRIVEGPTNDKLLDTGQRNRTFLAGLSIIKHHYLWGIGYKQWPVYMMKYAGFPFVSPHDGFLEVWGSYGAIGAILYFLLLAVAVRNYIRIESSGVGPIERWLNRGIALFLFAIVIHELVEVETVFAFTPYALWSWAALGAQDALLRSDEREKPKSLLNFSVRQDSA